MTTLTDEAISDLRALLEDFESGKLKAKAFAKRLDTLTYEELAWVAQDSLERSNKKILRVGSAIRNRVKEPNTAVS